MNVPHLQFFHSLVDGGLLYLNHYLEDVCKCNVFHISPTDRLIYDGTQAEQCLQLKQKIDRHPMDGESLFLEKENCMVYQITINESQQQLVFFRSASMTIWALCKS